MIPAEMEKKKPDSFRLSGESVRELDALVQESGWDKTAIVELGIMSVRPILEKQLANRVEAVRAGGRPSNSASPSVGASRLISAAEKASDAPPKRRRKP